MITYDPNGGDLGRALIKPIQPLEFLIIIPHVANILEELYNGQHGLYFKYAFEFSSHWKDSIELVMKQIQLPPHVHFYEVDGKNLFEMRGASGGIVSGLICYLVTHD